ncbi:MAG: 3-dehydroquinate synthase [bacterium]
MISRDLTVTPAPEPARPYPIHLRHDALPELIERTAALAATGRVIVISDATVAPLHAAPLADALRARGVNAPLLAFAPGEENKTLATVHALYAQAIAAGVDRHTPIVALGGGVVGDVAGFVAATLLRGLPWIAAPTTVLAQVDSSVGGKTGVDLPEGKNLVGAFHPPRFVFADAAWLTTLPARETRAGLAEAIKHAALADAPLLDRITRDGARLAAGDLAVLAPTIADAINIKAAIVADDPRDTGRRAILNFGHTLGHALEAATGYRALRHGEAVALGMRFAARLSTLRAGLAPAHVTRIDAALDAVGLPADWAPRIDDDVLARLATDKKSRAHSIDTILLRAIGDPCVVPRPLEALAADARALARGFDAEKERR